jgi:multidrug efflux pump subunit AcrA (membrane-fusion protein)
MSGDANFILSQKEDALFVPSEFVNSDKNGRFVNLGRANNKVRVTVGIEGEDQVEITSGVKEGDVLYD